MKYDSDIQGPLFFSLYLEAILRCMAGAVGDESTDRLPVATPFRGVDVIALGGCSG